MSFSTRLEYTIATLENGDGDEFAKFWRQQGGIKGVGFLR